MSSREEINQELFKDWDNEENRKAFFNNNINLVHYIVHRYENKGIEYEDLFQTASLGMWKAIRKFDPSLGYQFSTLAVRCMFGDISKLFRDKRKFGAIVDDVSVLSLYKPIYQGKDGDFIDIEDTVLDDKVVIDDEMLEKELKEILEEFIDLKYKDNVIYRRVIEFHLKGLTQMKISKKVGVSQPHVSRIIRKFQQDFKKYHDRYN